MRRGASAFTTRPNRLLEKAPFTAAGPKRLRVIENMDSSRAELQLLRFRNMERFQQREVGVEHSRSIEEPPPGIANPTLFLGD